MNNSALLLGAGSLIATSAALYFFNRKSGGEVETAATPAAASNTNQPNYPLNPTANIFNSISDGVMNLIGEPRGIRNNNPGNLVITNIAWKGKVTKAMNTDKVYEQFIEPLWGIRAMFMDVRGDIEKDGLNTIRKLITEYAPKFENNTAAYISFVSNKLGIGPDTKIQPSQYLNLLKAIIQQENGKQPYGDDLIIKAMYTP